MSTTSSPWTSHLTDGLRSARALFEPRTGPRRWRGTWRAPVTGPQRTRA
ncbi:hypothetical protein [Microbacterium sp.]|nr:hypothetical protein [Microbacterium sp.]HEX5730935.1 hypothetical protein [Microbacterium sp.]